MSLLRERRLFRSRNRAGPSSVSSSSTTSSAVRFARLHDSPMDGDEEASSLLLGKRSNKSSKTTTTTMTTLDDKENPIYDFRSVTSRDDDDEEEEEVLFAHLTERPGRGRVLSDAMSFDYDPSPNEFAALVTPPREKTSSSNLDKDMAHAFALVGLVLDSYPELRKRFVERYNKSDTDLKREDEPVEDVFQERATPMSTASTLLTVPSRSATTTTPPFEVWLLLIVMIGVVLALDILVGRLMRLFDMLL
jgi:hypothetical protein